MTLLERYKRIINVKYIAAIIITAYIVINIIYLTRFPFVHSDESWLSGLSRNIMDNQNFSVTEAFFDLYERHPHAIKIIFHSMQITFLSIFGYGIFTFRLLSFVFGLLTLYYFYKLCRHVLKDNTCSYAAVLLLGIDVQFVYASHFARQEIVLLFVLIFSLYFVIENIEVHSIKHDIILAGVIGLSIGLHPNSFIISIPFGLIYLYHIFITRKLKLINILLYVGVVALFALGFVALSIHFNPNFFYDYSRYGNEFEVFNPLTSKVKEVKDFYLKLYYGVSGTYYTPNIKLEFFLFATGLLFSIFSCLRDSDRLRQEKLISILLSLIGINAGIILIGRYNQTSIIFAFPLFYLLVVYMMITIKFTYKRITILVLAIILSVNTALNVIPFTEDNYRNYSGEVSKVVKSDDTVLANLNLEYYFENGRLYDYRNLAFLKDNGISFKDYILRNKIAYIIYPEEMDLIYKLRPTWNGIYGNLFYYDEMQVFLSNSCELIHEFTNGTYGIRIARYINTKDWKIRIYKVKKL